MAVGGGPDRLRHVPEIESRLQEREVAHGGAGDEDQHVRGGGGVDDQPSAKIGRDARRCVRDYFAILRQGEALLDGNETHGMSPQLSTSRTWARPAFVAAAFSAWLLVSISPTNPSEKN